MKIALKYLAILAVLIFSFIACDKDFASINSDIINDDTAANFLIKDTVYNENIIAYTKALDPVQTNNLPVNMLGVYNDPNYGTTYS